MSQTPSVRRPLWFRLTRWALVAFALYVLIVIGFYLWKNWTLDGQLDRAMARLDREHPGWRLADVDAARASVSVEENAMLVVLKAHALLPAGILTKPEFEDIPNMPPHRLLRETDSAALDKELDPAEAALIESRQLSRYRTGRAPITWSKDFISTLVPHCQKAREVGNALQADAARFGQKGKADSAWVSSQAILGAGRAIGDEPLLISTLVRIGVGTMSARSLERVLGQGQVSPALLAEAQEQLLDEAKQPLFKHGMRGEVGGMHELFGEIEKGNFNGALGILGGGRRLGKAAWLENLMGPWERIESKRGHIWYLEHNADLLTLLDEPTLTRKAGLQRLENKVKAEAPMVARLLAAATLKVSEAKDRYEALCMCAMTGIALERYRLMHGHWPAKLDDLVADGLLKEIPLDLHDGQPLRFRTTKDGVVVFSIGPDGKGDGTGLDAEPFNPDAARPIEFRLWNVESRRQPPLPPRPKDDPIVGDADRN